jgi:hypothetical protein
MDVRIENAPESFLIFLGRGFLHGISLGEIAIFMFVNLRYEFSKLFFKKGD